jgi:hypothetical protein
MTKLSGAIELWRGSTSVASGSGNNNLENTLKWNAAEPCHANVPYHTTGWGYGTFPPGYTPQTFVHPLTSTTVTFASCP